MSDINELIHTTCMHAYNQGIDTERNRILELLDFCSKQFSNAEPVKYGVDVCIALIKGENK